MAKIKNTVSRDTAKVLAERTQIALRARRNEIAKTRPAEVRKMTAHKELIKLFNQIEKLQNRAKKIETMIEEKYDVSISGTEVWYNSQVPGVKLLFGEIMVASQVDGIAPDELVNHIVKKYSK